MDSDYMKEVYFDKYCETCEYKDAPETDEPCCGCLEHPLNLYSHKPVNHKEKQKKKKSEKD